MTASVDNNLRCVICDVSMPVTKLVEHLVTCRYDTLKGKQTSEKVKSKITVDQPVENKSKIKRNQGTVRTVDQPVENVTCRSCNNVYPRSGFMVHYVNCRYQKCPICDTLIDHTQIEFHVQEHLELFDIPESKDPYAELSRYAVDEFTNNVKILNPCKRGSLKQMCESVVLKSMKVYQYSSDDLVYMYRVASVCICRDLKCEILNEFRKNIVVYLSVCESLGRLRTDRQILKDISLLVVAYGNKSEKLLGINFSCKYNTELLHIVISTFELSKYENFIKFYREARGYNNIIEWLETYWTSTPNLCINILDQQNLDNSEERLLALYLSTIKL